MAAKRIPQTVRFTLICLGVFASVQLLAGLGLAEFLLIVSALLTAGLMWALAVRQRWAYVLTFLVVVAGVVALLVLKKPALAAGVFALGGLVWVPLVMAREWYFPPRRKYGPA